MILHASSTSPNSEGQLQVLSTPSKHPLVISSNSPEEVSLNSKQSSSHGGSLGWIWGLSLLLHIVRKTFPGKVTTPRESSHRYGSSSTSSIVGQGSGVNHVDPWDLNNRRIILDPLSHGLQP